MHLTQLLMPLATLSLNGKSCKEALTNDILEHAMHVRKFKLLLLCTTCGAHKLRYLKAIVIPGYIGTIQMLVKSIRFYLYFGKKQR